MNHIKKILLLMLFSILSFYSIAEENENIYLGSISLILLEEPTDIQLKVLRENIIHNNSFESVLEENFILLENTPITDDFNERIHITDNIYLNYFIKLESASSNKELNKNQMLTKFDMEFNYNIGHFNIFDSFSNSIVLTNGTTRILKETDIHNKLDNKKYKAIYVLSQKISNHKKSTIENITKYL